MSDIAIKFNNISKEYRLGLVSTRTLSHDLNRWWQTSILHKEDPYMKIGETNDRSKKGESEYVWALKDIDFEVKKGDVLGIIGKNGAGKSTLLKILSRVTTPTTGLIEAEGRIASLLEVGTGFHPELTGRENIYMNGSIMGMTRKEIDRKLDEIVDFAGVERYIDTPAKRYSSGMTVRLGFAIAAHLDPEILVVDEVLAVGDAEFQKKAIGKMQDVSRGEGRTVLFVSHNMASIQALCNKGVLLHNGMVNFEGGIDETVKEYLTFNNNDILDGLTIEQMPRQGKCTKKITFYDIKFLNECGEQTLPVCGRPLNVQMFYRASEDIRNCRFSLDFSTESNCLLVFSTHMTIDNSINIEQGNGSIVWSVDKFPLQCGRYYITMFVEANGEIMDWINAFIPVDVEDGDFFGLGKNAPIGHSKRVLYDHRWIL